MAVGVLVPRIFLQLPPHLSPVTQSFGIRHRGSNTLCYVQVVPWKLHMSAKLLGSIHSPYTLPVTDLHTALSSSFDDEIPRVLQPFCQQCAARKE